MKTKVCLTAQNDDTTIYVDDVNVSKGVYSTNSEGVNVYFIGNHCSGYWTIISDAIKPYSEYKSLREWVDGLSIERIAYTISGKRITTEKQNLKNDLTNSDNIAWVHPNGKKGYIAYLGGGDFKKLPSYTNKENQDVCNVAYNSIETFKSVSLAAKNVCDYTEMYRFDTRKEMYQWLAE